MDEIFAMRSSVKFEDKLTYCKMIANSPKCFFDSTHSTETKWLRPLKVKGPVRPYTDFEWTVFGNLIINEQVRKEWDKTHFSGFRFQEVEFFTTSETPFGRDAVEFQVTGWGGRAGKESGIEVLEECPGCKRRIFSGYEEPAKLFNIDEWDGSDIFIIWPMPSYIFVTKDVRNWARDKNFTGVQFIPISDLPPSDTFTPNPIECYFDADIVSRIKGRDPKWW